VTGFSPAARARRAACAGVLCAVLAVSLSACKDDPDAGTNGVGKLSAKDIETRARKAVDGAQAVRVSGKLVSRGGSYKLDMRLRSDGGTGSVTSKRGTFELLRIDDSLYVKAPADFWRQRAGESGATAADKLDDKYVKVPKGDPAYDQFRGFTDMTVLLDGLLGLHGTLDKGDHTEVGGVRAIQITGAEGSRLEVSLTGTPYPLRLERAGGAGVLQLGDWDKPVTLSTPKKGDTLDYGRELPTS
jgi:hypothetical protein